MQNRNIKNNLLGLPSPILGLIANLLPPQDIAALSATCFELHYQLVKGRARSVWLNKLALHFPNEAARLEAQPINKWRENFVATYIDYYGKLDSRARWLLTLAAEGDLAGIIEGRVLYTQPSRPSFRSMFITRNEPFRTRHEKISLEDWTTTYYVQDISGARSPLFLASWNQYQTLLDHVYSMALTHFAELEAKSPQVPLNVKESQLIHYAVATNQSEDTIYALLEGGADVNATTLGDVTPLHFAVRHGHTVPVGVLLANGANADAKIRSGDTPLHCAATHGHPTCVELLLANGANVNARNHGGWTPLHRAIFYGHTTCVELLLANGANVNEAAGWGKEKFDFIEYASPLHIAIEKNTACVELLLTNGANINATRVKYNRGFVWKVWERGTPLELAIKLRKNDCVEQIKLAALRSRLFQSGWPLRLASIMSARDNNALLYRDKAPLMNRGAIMIAISVFLDHPAYSPYVKLANFPINNIWRVILNYAVNSSLTMKEWEDLAFLAAKEQINAVLTDYTQRIFVRHKERAKSFQSAVMNSKTKETLKSLMIQQSNLLLDPSKAPGGDEKHLQSPQNNSVDGYHKLVHRWANRFFSPAAVDNEDNKVHSVPEADEELAWMKLENPRDVPLDNCKPSFIG